MLPGLKLHVMQLLHEIRHVVCRTRFTDEGWQGGQEMAGQYLELYGLWLIHFHAAFYELTLLGNILSRIMWRN
jgi:hypothetical protein